ARRKVGRSRLQSMRSAARRSCSFAVPGGAMEATVAGLTDEIRGRILIDASNRVGAPVVHSEALAALGDDRTSVFRAFNSLGVENFANPRYGNTVADLFFSGPGGAARSTVEGLISDVGLRPIYVGTDASLVDSVLLLWFALANGQGRGRNIAFK